MLIDVFKLKNTLRYYKVDVKALAYRKDWPKIAQGSVSRKKIDRLFNFCKKSITSLENDQSRADDTTDDGEDKVAESQHEDLEDIVAEKQSDDKTTQTRIGQDFDRKVQPKNSDNLMPNEKKQINRPGRNASKEKICCKMASIYFVEFCF